MPHVELLISNNRHHWAMMSPVLDALAAVPGYTRGLISLSELRGMVSPADPSGGGTADRLARLIPAVRRTFAWSPQTAGGAARRAIRGTLWRLWLGPRLDRRLRQADLVVTPNDGAFPFDRICARLRQLGTPFLLIQEGIRFPRPASSDVGYGRGGATAVAAWGAASAAYFRSRGVPADRIHLTGSPRFDGIFAVDWTAQAAALRAQLGIGDRNLLVLSSPIDMMGYTTAAAKAALLARFLDGLRPLWADPEFHLLVKLHAAESASPFDALVAGLPDPSRVRILGDAPLYPLLHLARAAIVLASTAGLEAMLFGVPVGVVELPGVGFVHDYVSSGAAAGLTWGAPLAPQLTALMAPSASRARAMREYVHENLATREGATDRIVKLIRDLVPVR